MNRFPMIFFCIGLLCCRDDEKIEALPSNLVLEVNVSNDLSGLVTIKATDKSVGFVARLLFYRKGAEFRHVVKIYWFTVPLSAFVSA